MADTLTALGNTVQLSARALDEQGNEVTSAEFTWTTSDEGILAVDEQGLAEAVANGQAEITATASGVTGSAELAVIQQVSAVTVSPASATLTTAGATQQFAATAADENGNEVSGASLVWASEDHEVATVDRNGLATAKGSGAVTITATAQDVPGHADLTVNQAIDRLAFRTEPTDATAGEAIDPAVQVAVLDTDGGVVEDAEIAVTLSIGTNPEGGTLGGSATVNAVNGVATFSNVWIDAAATGYTLAAATSGTVTGAASQSFDVGPGPAAALAFTAQPSNATAGQAVSPAVEVQVRDAFGNLLTGSTAQVSVSLAANPGGGTLAGSVTVPASGGTAAFADLWIDAAATGYRLQATSPSLDPDVSAAFAVVPGPAARLGFRTQPEDSEGKEPLSPTVQVEIRDEFGNAVPGASAQVSVSLGSNPRGDALAGTTTVATVDGIASLPDLSLSLPGNGYSLLASASGLAGAESDLFDVDITLTQVEAGNRHTCGVTVAGHAYCWGVNDWGQLGVGTQDTEVVPHSAPLPVAGELTFAQVAAGDEHTCGVTTADEAYCWGNNSGGQVGRGFTSVGGVSTPTAVVGGLSFSRLSTGSFHTCGVTTADEAYCWGGNTFGSIGDGTTTLRSSPVAVSGGLAMAQVSAGSFYTCGVTTADEAHCWGGNADGQLGDGTTTDRLVPTAVSGGLSLVAVTAGATHTCGVTTADEAHCWGGNADGQLGDGTTTDRLVPTAVSGGLSLVEVSAGGQFFTCARAADGAAYCWGHNGAGQLGTGTAGGSGVSTPQAVVGGLTFTGVTAGGVHTCGLTTVDGAYCWGSNDVGQLGDGSTTTSRTSPSRVVQ